MVCNVPVCRKASGDTCGNQLGRGVQVTKTPINTVMFNFISNKKTRANQIVPDPIQEYVFHFFTNNYIELVLGPELQWLLEVKEYLS